VHKSGRYGHNLQVEDYMIQFWSPSENKYIKREVYGPERAKILARYSPGDRTALGNYIARSDDNLGLYALAMYVQRVLGAYPHLPLVNTEPSRRPWVPPRNDLFLVDGAGAVTANLSTPDDVLSADFLPALSSTITMSKFIDDSELPATYLAQWKNWSLGGF
jgi:hypothetical protein